MLQVEKKERDSSDSFGSRSMSMQLLESADFHIQNLCMDKLAGVDMNRKILADLAIRND